MGQTFHVVRCYSCKAFQSQQVRKDKKFVCKICGAKQSVKKNYGEGSGKDCRLHVQKLNSLRGSLEEEESLQLTNKIEEEYNEGGSRAQSSNSGFFSDNYEAGNSFDDTVADTSRVSKQGSKWSSYMSSDSGDSGEDDAVPSQPYTSNYSHTRGKYGKSHGLKNKASRGPIPERDEQSNTQGPIRCRQSRAAENSVRGNHFFEPYPGSNGNVHQEKGAENSFNAKHISEPYPGSTRNISASHQKRGAKNSVCRNHISEPYPGNGIAVQKTSKWSSYITPSDCEFSEEPGTDLPRVGSTGMNEIQEEVGDFHNIQTGGSFFGQEEIPALNTRKVECKAFELPNNICSSSIINNLNSKIKQKENKNLLINKVGLLGDTIENSREKYVNQEISSDLGMDNGSGNNSKVKPQLLMSEDYMKFADTRINKEERSTIKETYKKFEDADDFDDLLCDVGYSY